MADRFRPINRGTPHLVSPTAAPSQAAGGELSIGILPCQASGAVPIKVVSPGTGYGEVRGQNHEQNRARPH